MIKTGLYTQGECEECTNFISFLLKCHPRLFVIFWKNNMTNIYANL